MEDLGRLISEHPFFGGLSRDYLEAVLGCAGNVRFSPDELVFRAGEPADNFYLVRRGLVAVQLQIPGRGDVTIQTINPGSVLGWSWIFPPYVTYFDARALESTVATAFDGACLRRKSDCDPALGYELTKRFAELLRDRLRATHLQLLDLYKVPDQKVEV